MQATLWKSQVCCLKKRLKERKSGKKLGGGKTENMGKNGGKKREKMGKKFLKIGKKKKSIPSGFKGTAERAGMVLAWGWAQVTGTAHQ